MGNCEEVKKDIEDFFKKEGLIANVIITGCTETGKSTLRIALSVGVEINGACINPKEHHKSVKDRILEELENLEGEFQLADAFVGQEDIEDKTNIKIEEAKEFYDKLYDAVKEW